MTLRGAALSLAASLILLALGVLAASELLLTPWAVAGGSMEPGLLSGDRVLVDRWTYRQRRVRPGEVVLLVGPRDVPMVKRVHEAPPDALWVVGDNEADSVDSRSFGALPDQRLIGRVVFRYWPLSRVGPLRRVSAGASAPAARATPPPGR